MTVPTESNAPSEAPHRAAGGASTLPWTRSKAFRFWMVAVATTAVLETAVVALAAAFPAAAGHREAG